MAKNPESKSCLLQENYATLTLAQVIQHDHQKVKRHATTTIQKSKTRRPLKQRHKSKRLKWVRKYKKIGFSNVIFTNNKCHATLDGGSKVEEGSSSGLLLLMIIL